MAASPVCVIDETGIHAPDFATVLAYFEGGYRAIYGEDVYLGNDAQDGQWVALIAAAFNDANAQTISAYNAFSPATAQGAGLSRVVKINGIARSGATFSTADLTIIGQAGAEITNGLAQDDDQNQWALPSLVTIPDTGTITVTALCLTVGAITALPNTITSIATPTYGWQTVTNPAAATPGRPVETDAALRQRQALSTALPSLSLFEGLVGAVSSLPGVARVRGHENTGDVPDAKGLPGHAVCLVVDGGDAATIARTIATKKGPGTGTYGTTSETLTDSVGVSRRIAFSRPVTVPVAFALTVRSLGGYTTSVDAEVKATLATWARTLGIGQNVYRDAAYVPAKLNGSAKSRTYDILSLSIGRDGQVPTQADVALSYDEVAVAESTSVTITVVA